MFKMKAPLLLLGLMLGGVSSYLLYLMYKDDEEDDFNDAFIKASNFKTLEMKINRDHIRSLIGRNGNNIKQIQSQSNTKINFKEKDDTKICVIKGSVESCAIAESLILEFINSQPVLESEDVWVPAFSIGKIIGRSGESIANIQSLSGAKLHIYEDDGRNSSSKRIGVKGTKEQIAVAKSLIEEIVEKAKDTAEKLESSLAKREPRLPPKQGVEPTKASTAVTASPKVERMSPVPGQAEAPFEVYVSAMIDPSRFWIQIVGPKATELDLLVEEMTEYYGKTENRDLHILENVTKGDLVAAIFQYDSKWYRAEILAIFDDKEHKEPLAQLYYVDYGDTDIVPVNQVYELRTDFLRLHFQAIECYLANVEPVGESWSEDAVDKFEEWTHVAKWKKLSAKINGYSILERTRAKREGSPLPGVDLYDVVDDKDVDIAEELVKCGFANYKKNLEPRNSRSNSRTTSMSNLSVGSSCVQE